MKETAYTNPQKGLLLVLALTFLSGFATDFAAAQTLYVNPGNECGGAYSTLRQAAAAAPEGSTIILLACNYNDAVTINNETNALLTLNQKGLTISSQGGPATIGRPLGTQRLWQLTGERDLERGTNTASQTISSCRLRGTDLGASVRHGDRIYFLFGDTWEAAGVERPFASDSVAWIPANTDPEQSMHLNFITNIADGAYLPPTVVKPDGTAISNAEFEVPVGGFSALGKMYAFFSTDHKKLQDGDYMGRSVLARLDDINNNRFTYLYDASCVPGVANSCSRVTSGKFINIAPVLVTNESIPELFNEMGPGQGVLLWGTGLYKKSDPYLAYVPLAFLLSPESWRYAVVSNGGRDVTWSRYESNATRLFIQDCANSTDACNKMGELSVAWNDFLHKWIMLYNHDNPRGINYRVADKPWGPWSEKSFVLFEPSFDRGYCHFMHRSYTNCHCDSIIDSFLTNPENVYGGEYAPYIIPSFTKGDATTTTIYWTMSTWNPYQVMLMKSTLRLSDARRIDHPQQP